MNGQGREQRLPAEYRARALLDSQLTAAGSGVSDLPRSSRAGVSSAARNGLGSDPDRGAVRHARGQVGRTVRLWVLLTTPAAAAYQARNAVTTPR